VVVAATACFCVMWHMVHGVFGGREVDRMEDIVRSRAELRAGLKWRAINWKMESANGEELEDREWLAVSCIRHAALIYW